MGLFSSNSAPLTEKNLPDQSGKVFIVTGSTAGIGKHLAGILYQHNARVYVAARSASKGASTIDELKRQHPNSSGSLIFLQLDFNDLTGIKASAQEFLKQESRLDVLWNNAGVMVPPQGSKTKQGFELQLGVNNVGPFLFTKILTPLLIETAKTAPSASVRVVWVASSAVERFSPKGGVEMDNLDYSADRGAWTKYGTSKAGNVFHGTEFARRYGDKGVLSVSLDPGVLKTDLYANVPKWQNLVLSMVLHEPIWGAYTELFGGLSETLTMKDNGAFLQPWGKIGALRKDVEIASKTKEAGGTNTAVQFWDWTEEQVAAYA
ncbi:NAD(P)-binding-containing protein [Coleophoma cylindrospora]|uniref:NAD(P)-binding-containing protein n=1 Tax=Coleophoma cylindrospora TaxID=1849047 RepID=A0A3D8QP79_9HELO|nr:NAD(P)-binding-containing protein [Coleophoma cylindrospora]